MTGSGDFSLGSEVWPGTSKLLEEMGELQQVLGKLIAVAGSTEHWDGDLKPRLVEELADVAAAMKFFIHENLEEEERLVMIVRAEEKLALFRKWHEEHAEPTRFKIEYHRPGEEWKMSPCGGDGWSFDAAVEAADVFRQDGFEVRVVAVP
jgi:hypothetical protein